MPLGLLAKDSIQDLENLGKDYGESNKTTSEADEEAAAVVVSQQQEDNNKNTVTSFNRTASSDADAASQASVESSTKANPQQPEDYNANQRTQQQQQQQQQHAQFDTSYYYNNHAAFEDYYSPHDSLYAATSYATQKKQHVEPGSGLLGCLFPWLVKREPQQLKVQEEKPTTTSSTEKRLEQDRAVEYEEKKSDNNGGGEKAEEDGESANSNALGERLSDRERQAVLARLRLAQPQAVVAGDHQHSSSHSEMLDDSESLREYGGGGDSGKKRRGLLNGIPVYDTSPLLQEEQNRDFGALNQAPPALKGILKKRSMSNVDHHVMKNGVLLQKRALKHADTGSSTGSIGTPTAAPSTTAPRVAHRRSLFPSYEDRTKPRTNNTVIFAPMARVVTVKSKNNMTDEEKGDIWWRRSDYEDFRKTGRIITRAMLEGGSEIWLASIESSWNKKKDKKADKDISPEGSESGDTISSTKDKWWHKFGHSRRGLEHVVSMDEGRQRQMNVKKAIRAVLDEHARQKYYKRVDREKLRIVSLHHTSWARDLALASAASDAHAVETSFSKDRRSREFYLLKIAKTSPKTTVNKSVPQFMQPVHSRKPSGASSNLVQQRLDANTASQISFRRRSTHQAVEPSAASAATSPKATTQPEARKKPNVESCEPVHDPNPDATGNMSLAEQAAGFSADGEKVNMAAVLSGMGAVLKEDEKLPTRKVAS